MSASTLLWGGLNWLKVDRLLEPATRSTGWTILWGHGVCAKPSRWHRDDPRHIPVQVFERQMEWLLAQRYQFITLGEGVRRLANGDPLDRTVTLTFDDGFLNVVQLAYPVMRRLNLKGCLFVIADLVDKDQLLWTDKIDVICRWHQGSELEFRLPHGRLHFRLDNDHAVNEAIHTIKRSFRTLPDAQRRQVCKQLEELFAKVDDGFVPDDFRLARLDELRSLDPQVMEIGNHTMSHPQLKQVGNVSSLRWEIGEAKAKLESWMQRPITHFCYPAGDYGAEVITEVKQAGHHSGLTVRYGVNRPEVSPFELRRLVLPPDLARFKCRISGLEGRLQRIKAWIKSEKSFEPSRLSLDETDITSRNAESNRCGVPAGSLGQKRVMPCENKRVRRLLVFSTKPTWFSPSSPTGFATDGGFPFQMAALGELFDETVLLVPCSPRTVSQGEIPLGGPRIRVSPLPPPYGSGLRRKLLFPIWCLRCTPAVMGEFRRAEAIHADIPGDLGTVGMVLAWTFRRPLFVRYCGNWLTVKTTADRFWHWFMERFAGGRNVMLATGGIAEPPSRKNPNIRWIFATSLTESEIRELATGEVSLAPEKLRLVIVGRQEGGKGTDLMIKALSLIHQQFPNAVMDVVGDGSEVPMLKRKAAELGVREKVAFHGKVNHVEVIRLLQQAHIFCFPTQSEGFPKAVLEALACGLPVITTPVSVLPMLLSKGCGVIIKPEAAAIAQAVCELASSPERYKLMSAKARETAAAYTLERWRDTIGGCLEAAWGPLREP
jgi:glycosyltransferase involved in cell wall biosynthesis/peptidoglycan/xylan/chitin deacetylase (PgdA/CDA1 family)